MYFDSSLNIDGAGAGVYFISPSGDRLSYVLWIHFKVSNNAAEYETTLHGLRIAIECWYLLMHTKFIHKCTDRIPM
jgi:ribonuclease HI